MARFSERTKRLKRAREASAVQSLMPFAWIIGLAGFLGMGAIGVDYSVHGRWEEGVFIACAAAGAVPLLVLVIRLLRGHFNAQLKDQ